MPATRTRVLADGLGKILVDRGISIRTEPLYIVKVSVINVAVTPVSGGRIERLGNAPEITVIQTIFRKFLM